MWLSTGKITDPTAGQVLLEHGPYGSFGNVSFTIIASTTAADLTLKVEHRNAANDSTLNSQYLYVAKGVTAFTPQFPANSAPHVQAGERIRIVNENAITGSKDVSVSLFITAIDPE